MKLPFKTAALAAGVALALPAQATLLFSIDVDGVNVARYIDNCVASATCPGGDQNPAVGTLALAANTSFGGVLVNGSVQIANTAGPVFSLNSSSLQITSAAAHHVDAAVGATGFLGPANTGSASASGTVQTGAGSSFAYSFFNDPLNGQGAENPFDTPGGLFSSFSFTATDPLADAYSFASGASPVNDPGVFSMTQTFTADLTADMTLVGNSQTFLKTAVHEPASLAMLIPALIGAGFILYRRRDNGAGTGSAA